MIPYEFALIAWIPISFLLMMNRDSARGFSLAFLIGICVLPEGEKLDLPMIPDLGKMTVTNIGVLLGTLVWHPQVFDRFKFSLADLLLAGYAACLFMTSFVNGVGARDGVSQMLGFFMGFLLTVFLARLHLSTLGGLKTFLLYLVYASILYAPLSLYEFRMSPQIHQTLYGYFQHQFAQHMRSGWYRPVICFSHALDLGRFYAFTAFLALFPMPRDLIARFGPMGGYAFLAPLGGLILSQSYSPYLLFALLTGGYYVVRRASWTAYAMPAVAFGWLLVVMTGYTPGYGVIDAIQGVNEERADSLEYRMDAWTEYRDIIVARPLFGWGGWGQGRIEGRATDSQALIRLLEQGFIGAGLYFAWWFAMLHMSIRVMRRSSGTVFGERAAGAVTMLSLALTIAVIDAALDEQVIMIAAAFYSLYHLRLATPGPPDVPLPANRRRRSLPAQQSVG